jgi:hypothetical protein
MVSIPLPTLEEDGHPFDGPLSTYKEWHSLLLGLGTSLALAVATIHDIRLAATVAVVAVRMVVYALTGRRVYCGRVCVDLPDRLAGQIRAEPHYLFGGLLPGPVIAILIVLK